MMPHFIRLEAGPYVCSFCTLDNNFLAGKLMCAVWMAAVLAAWPVCLFWLHCFVKIMRQFEEWRKQKLGTTGGERESKHLATICWYICGLCSLRSTPHSLLLSSPLISSPLSTPLWTPRSKFDPWSLIQSHTGPGWATHTHTLRHTEREKPDQHTELQTVSSEDSLGLMKHSQRTKSLAHIHALCAGQLDLWE